MMAFCHIPKTAGMAVVDIFKYQYGIRYLQTTGWKLGSRYTASALNFDLMASPGLKCVGGHGIRPCLSFGRISHKFKWFTLIRNPLDRVLSHYVYDVQIGRGKWPNLESWLMDGHDNYQSRWIAGKADGDMAIQIIKDKFISVGLQDYFIESMHHLATICRWKRLVCPPTRVNATKEDDVKKKAKREAQDISDLIEEMNSEDIKLYNFVKIHIWPQQMKTIMNSEVEISSKPNIEEKLRSKMNNIYRGMVYKPFLFADRCLK